MISKIKITSTAAVSLCAMLIGITGSVGAEEPIDSLAEMMIQAVTDKQVAGASFIVVHQGEVVFREGVGYADIESKRPFTADELQAPIKNCSILDFSAQNLIF